MKWSKKIKKWVALLLPVFLVTLSFNMPVVAELTDSDEVTRLVSQMSTEQKICQMLMPAFRNYEGEKVTLLPQDIKDFLSEYAFGGVCLFAENFSDTEQSVRLTDELQSALPEGSPQLFLSADQEGGIITRIKTGTQMPGNMALGATGDSKYAVQSATIIGNELKALGINMDFAPVIDVNNNPTNPIIGLRSFSDDPDTVAEFGKAYIKGLGGSGTIGTVKHFPGHGDTSTDSHSGLASIDKSYDELKELELVPYQACIDSGVDMIMTAHIQYPQIETDGYLDDEGNMIYYPATLSKTIITDILRGDMGYDGVVTTDAMNMGAIVNYFGRYEAAALSINAGVDILLMPVNVVKADDLDDFKEYIETLVGMVEDGTISAENVDKSVTRILTLKQKKGLLESYSSENLDERIASAKEYVGCEANHDVEWEIAKKAITLVKNDNALPIDVSDGKTVVINHDDDYELSTEFAISKLIANGEIPSNAEIGNYPSFYDAEIEDIKEFIGDAKNVIIDTGISSVAKLNPEKNADIEKINEMIEYVHENGGKVTVISYWLPYDAGLYQNADAIMLAYSYKAMTSLPGAFDDYILQYGANVPAAIYLCMSQSESPTGVLPVNIPKITDDYKLSDEVLYERGYSLHYTSVPVDNSDTVDDAADNTVDISSKGIKVSGIKKKYVYTGKKIKPQVAVKYNGTTLLRDKDFSVTFSKNKKVGTAKITIKGIGTYTGTIKKTFKIVPKAVKSVKVKGKKKGLRITWKSRTAQTGGYQIAYSKKNNFKSAKYITVKNKKTKSKTIKKLKRGTKYYVRIRAYKKVSGKKYYSKWSKAAHAKAL